MWLMTLVLGCGSPPTKPYRIDEATGVFTSWKSNSCTCRWDVSDLSAQVSCSSSDIGEATLYLPFNGSDANQRLAGSAVAQIDMGLASSGFTGGPVIWEYSSAYEDPRASDRSAAFASSYRRDVVIHELVLPPVNVCSALPPATCADVEESRLKMALTCAS